MSKLKDLAVLYYCFMFDVSADTWSRGTDFENDFATFLRQHGLEANILKTAGNSPFRMIYVERVDKMDRLRNASDMPQKGLQKSLQSAMSKAQNAGKEVKKNG